MLDRLKTLIEQHSYSPKNKICILSDDKSSQLLNKVSQEYNASFLKLTDDFDPFTLIVTKYKNKNGITLQFINEQIKKAKKFILIVEKDFDFSNLVQKTKANLIDAIILKDESQYMIVVSKD